MNPTNPTNPTTTTSSAAQHSAQDTTSGDPGKVSGHMHTAKGNVKEGLGNVTGSTRLQQKGQQEYAAGQGEIDAAKGQGYAHGATERAAGKKDEVVGAATGDRTQQARGDLRQDQGAFQSDLNRSI